MSESHPLPQNLRYLSLVRRQLSNISLDQLREDNDTTLLEEVLRKRIGGLPEDIASRLLRSDRAELREWLSRSGRERDPLHFVDGFLLLAADAIGELRSPQVEKTVTPNLAMEFPPEVQPKCQQSSIEFSLHGVIAVVGACNRDNYDEQLETFRIATNLANNPNVCSLNSVKFGLVHGFKMASVSRVAGTPGMKTVNYALAVPGGYAGAMLHAKRIDWSEAEFEKYLATIRVVPVKVK